jgi:hypothetical protein
MSESSTATARPMRWSAILSAAEWSAAVEAIGRERAEELHTLLAAVAPGFRRRFVAELTALSGEMREGQRVLLALARATQCPAQRPGYVALLALMDGEAV